MIAFTRSGLEINRILVNFYLHITKQLLRLQNMVVQTNKNAIKD